MSIVNSQLGSLVSDKEKSAYLAKIRSSKDKLIHSGINPFENLRVEPEVAESWIASYNAGVDPYAPNNSEYVDYDDLSKRLAANVDIVAAVDETISRFLGVLKKMISSIFYADSDGVVLYVLEGEVSNDNYRQFGTRVGGLWNEEITGTSAISLCVKHRDVVQLVGPEHYGIVMQDHLTTAVPIRGSDGEFFGVLAMTTLHNKVGTGLSYSQPYNLGLALALASSIERLVQFERKPYGTDNGGGGGLLVSGRSEEGARFPALQDLIGLSAAFSSIKKLAKQAALTKANAFIYGEMGVGKFTLAKAIAAERGLSPDSLAVLSFSGMPDLLIEEEMFGREGPMGVVEKVGILEQAKDGVLIIMEIGDAPARIQHALLNAIEERSFRRIGGAARVRLGSFQVVSTSEFDPAELVKLGKLRSDLAITVSQIKINIPPLRERRDDERLLIGHFLKHAGERSGMRRPPHLSSRAMQVLLETPLRGNVRQLRDALQYAVIVSEGETINEDDFPLGIEDAPAKGFSEEDGDGVMSLKDAERAAIENALAFTNGNIREAAKVLGISRSTLYRKMDEYRIAR
ncbi:MAG TPA: sigma-54-dependent Fis family transcriptional regulator [Candidatus Aphodovivens excrementavium]|nr:sigma-54-dependent Fis family transcriptional regulator [Candidatus Aphodovivens avistercoris]HIT46125.1 sigma-54-dependent Fis family transcriptional regulator [Candidatus Aphodovivens excrementavium]